MTNRHLLFPLIAAAAMIGPVAGETAWETNMPQAIKRAQQENKFVLVLFTGSDWCGPCIELKQNILSKEEFKNYAKDKYVLLELDYPQRSTQSEEVKQDNLAIKEKYNIAGFPTIFVLDTQGVVLSSLVGNRASFADVEKALAPALDEESPMRKASAAALMATEGQRAEALQAIYDASPRRIKPHNRFLLEEVKDSAPATPQAQSEAEAAESLKRIQTELSAMDMDYDKAMKLVETELAKPNLHLNLKKELMHIKSNLLFLTLETAEDVQVLQNFLTEELSKVDPDTESVMNRRIRNMVNLLQSSPESVIEQAKQYREVIKNSAQPQTQPQ